MAYRGKINHFVRLCIVISRRVIVKAIVGGSGSGSGSGGGSGDGSSGRKGKCEGAVIGISHNVCVARQDSIVAIIAVVIAIVTAIAVVIAVVVIVVVIVVALYIKRREVALDEK